MAVSLGIDPAQHSKVTICSDDTVLRAFLALAAEKTLIARAAAKGASIGVLASDQRTLAAAGAVDKRQTAAVADQLSRTVGAG